MFDCHQAEPKTVFTVFFTLKYIVSPIYLNTPLAYKASIRVTY